MTSATTFRNGFEIEPRADHGKPPSLAAALPSYDMMTQKKFELTAPMNARPSPNGAASDTTTFSSASVFPELPSETRTNANPADPRHQHDTERRGTVAH